MEKIIDEVLEAEKRVAQIVDEAKKKAAQIKSEVENEVSEKLNKARLDAKELLLKASERAREEAKKEREERVAKTDEQGVQFRTIHKKNIEDAVQTIVTMVIDTDMPKEQE